MTVTTTRTALAAMPGNEDRLAVTAPAPAASPRVGASLVASALVTATTTRAALAAMRRRRRPPRDGHSGGCRGRRRRR